MAVAVSGMREARAVTPVARPAVRLGYVDGLRALAALDVVAGHTAQTIWYRSAPPWWAQLPLSIDHFAVSLFIVLSGCSLMLPVTRRAGWLQGGALTFYRRRARRILPPYYAGLALSLLLIWLAIGQPTGRLGDIAIPVSWSGVAQHLLMVNDLTGSTQINPVYWSVALECQIYLLFPLLVWLWRRYHPVFVTTLTLVTSLCLLIGLGMTPVARVPGFLGTSIVPQYLGLFGVGMLAAWMIARPTQALVWLAAHHLLDAGAIVTVILFALAMRTWGLVWLDYLVGVAALCVLLAASRQGALRAALEWRPLVWIGGFSYSLYLIHAPLLQLLWQYALHPLHLSDTATYLLLLLVGGPLIVVAAWGFYWVFERPFLSAGAHKSARTS